MNFRLQEWLEVINGAWAVAAASLFLVCVFYLHHEWVARGFTILHSRKKLTLGMRVAISIGTLSLGVVITRALVWVWRVLYGAGTFHKWQMAILVVGAVVGLAGFLCAVREYSRTLYGEWPWILTTVTTILVALLTALPHFAR